MRLRQNASSTSPLHRHGKDGRPLSVCYHPAMKIHAHVGAVLLLCMRLLPVIAVRRPLLQGTVVLLFKGLLPVPGYAGDTDWALRADDWARPRDGRSVAAMSPLPEVVAAWEQQPDQRLLVRYPGGEEGLLWAHELRSWLVALGIPMRAQELVAGSGKADRVELELTRVACIQMASGPNVGANLLEAERLIGMAVDKGAKLVVLPENFAIMGKEETDKVAVRESDQGGPIQDFLSHQAKRQGIWLVGGTVPLAAQDDRKVRAACLLYDEQGRRVARYDKIHLFDVVVGSDESYTESQTIESGDQAVVVDTPFGRLGLAVCYDLRFPELFRTLVDQGVEIIALPSAFTGITGKAHWEVLVRARGRLPCKRARNLRSQHDRGSLGAGHERTGQRFGPGVRRYRSAAPEKHSPHLPGAGTPQHHLPRLAGRRRTPRLR